MVEVQPGAAPFHDWNERIFHECYRANAYARVFDEAGNVVAIVNNYRHLSFNMGPTLLSWLEAHHPISYARILDADQQRQTLDGHGNAMAQAYNHCILPLSNDRDRVTQIRWGLADFAHRFGRQAEGMWLAETAANHEVLDLMIDHNIKFTLLSPYQAARVRPIGDEAWQDVSGGRVDPTQIYRYSHSDKSGRSIALFFYDGPLSKGIAFEGSLASSDGFLQAMSRGQGDGPLVMVATDGESYGHHFHFGDRTLAHALDVVAPERDIWFTHPAHVLAHNDPTHDVEIDLGEDGLGSSWSCAHGVGRWFRNCGCHTGGQDGWNQEWRKPLRDALDYIRDEAQKLFEEHATKFFEDPWAARDDYIHILLDPGASRSFFARHARTALSDDDRTHALTLLEMQHNAMLMYTSCGWFFADLAGIETLQCLKYAGRCLDYMKELNHTSCFLPFLEKLALAKSNKGDNGAELYRKFVDSSRVSPRRVAAHLAINQLVDSVEREGELADYHYQIAELRQRAHGRLQLLTSRVHLENQSTGRRHEESVAALHLGGVDFYCVVRHDLELGTFLAAAERLWSQLSAASLPTLLRLASQDFGPKEYGLEQLLPGGAQQVSERVLGRLLRRFSEQYAFLYADHRRTIEMLQQAGFALPPELTAAAEFTLGRQLEQEILQQRESRDPNAYARAIEIAEEAHTRGYRLDPRIASQTFDSMIYSAVHTAVVHPTQENVQAALDLLGLAHRLRLGVNLDRAQERAYSAALKGKLQLGMPSQLLLPALRISTAVIESKS